MLPSSGYFRSNVCPFFKSGLCERPQCHFKHIRPETTGAVSTDWTTNEVDDIIDKKPDIAQLANNVNAPPTYNPTPVAKCSGTQGILKQPSIKQESASFDAPEYKPTPISQLKNFSIKPEAPEVTYLESIVGRKRKKVVEEYVPEEVRCPSRKRVSFNIPEDNIKKEEEDSDDIITLESSDEDIADAPEFSDDDDVAVEVVKPVSVKCEPDIFSVKCEPDVSTTSDNCGDDEVIPIGEFSLVDKILVDVTKNDEFIRSFKNPPKPTAASAVIKSEILTDCENNSSVAKSVSTVKKSSTTQSECNKSIRTNNAKKTEVAQDKSSHKSHPNHVAAKKDDIKKEKSTKNVDSKSNSIKSSHDTESSKKHSSSSTSSNKTDSKTVDASIKKHHSHSDSSKKDKSHHESLDKKDTSSKSKHKSSSESHERRSSKSENESRSSKAENESRSSKTENESRVSKNENESKSTKHKSSSKTESKSEKKLDHQKSSHSSSSTHKDTKSEKKTDKPKSHTSKTEVKDKKTDSHSKSKDKTESSKSHKYDKHSSSKRKSESLSSKSSSDAKKLKVLHNDSETSVKDSSKIQDEKITSSSVITKKSKSSDSKSNHSKIENRNDRHSHSKTEKKEKPESSKSHSSSPTKGEISTSKSSKSVQPSLTVENVPSSPEKSSSGLSDAEFTSDSEADVDEECWRIFNEPENSSYDNFTHENATAENSAPENTNDLTEDTHNDVHEDPSSLTTSKKKRFAHQASFERQTTKELSRPPAKLLNPAQVMHNRYLKLQEMHAKQGDTNPQKKRIAAVPNSSLVNAVMQKNKYPSSKTSNHISELSVGDPTSRVNSTLKGSTRVAHVPIVATKPRPIIPNGIGNKIPSNIRQKYLNSFIDECLKFCKTEDQAYAMALDEEKVGYDRCSSRTVYLNVAANALNRLRRRAQEGPIDDAAESHASVSSTTSLSDFSQKTVSHETVLAGARAQKLSYSIEKRKYKAPEVVIKGIALYNALKEYVMTEDQLQDHGFPFLHSSEPGRAVISGIYSHKQVNSAPVNDSLKRICSRCQKTYYVNGEGDYVKEEECDFHWGKLYKRRIAGQFEARYTCCTSDAEADGCCVGPGHVFEGFDTHLLKGFVQTLPKTPPPDKYYGVYALDCEMCYTTAGIELTRVTVISPDMKPIFETYVKPENRVLDYNTRFSGIKAEDLEGVTTSIRDVQAIMLLMFNDKTILIGHSLESDLKALKLVHKTVVDTSIVFPHKLGLPYKRGLRTLMAEKCNKIIQNSTEGHDSQEDALACMELMVWRLKEDAKCPR